MADAGRTREQIQNGMGVATLEQMTVPIYIRTVGYLNQAIAKLKREADEEATSGEADR
jgi:hypothetical protein